MVDDARVALDVARMTLQGGGLATEELRELRAVAQALTPDFGKLSPAKGAKKMFGRSAWMRLLMHVVCILAVGALLDANG